MEGASTTPSRDEQSIAQSDCGSESVERHFEKLYLESYGMVYNFVRLRMSDESATEDVVAEAFLLAARSFSTFDPKRAKFSTWVTKIAINCMNSYYRKHRQMVSLDTVPEILFARPGEQDEFADKDLVDRLLCCLEPPEREVVIMKYAQGFRNVDIAAELDMNASTVSTMVSRALAKMRAHAEGQGVEALPAVGGHLESSHMQAHTQAQE